MGLKIRAKAPRPKFLCAFSPPGRTALDHSLIIAELTHRGKFPAPTSAPARYGLNYTRPDVSPLAYSTKLQ
jgi:hypothetical protein